MSAQSKQLITEAMRTKWTEAARAEDAPVAGLSREDITIRLMENLMEEHTDALTTRFKLKDNTLRGVPLLDATKVLARALIIAFAPERLKKA